MEIELSVDKVDTIFDSRTVSLYIIVVVSLLCLWFIGGRPSVHKPLARRSVHKPLGDVEFYNQLYDKIETYSTY